MCNECRQHPCHPRCPNSEESHKYIGCCECCGKSIYENEIYATSMDNNVFCDTLCAMKFYGIEEIE